MPSIVIFDLGGVLLDWDPRRLYRKIFASEAEVDWFLSEVCTHEWHLAQDSGRPAAEAVAELSARFPDYSGQIAAFYDREVPAVVSRSLAMFNTAVLLFLGAALVTIALSIFAPLYQMMGDLNAG